MAYDDTTAFLQDLAADALSSARENASRIHSQVVSVAGLRNPRASSLSFTKPAMGAPPKFSDLFGADTTDAALAFMDSKMDAYGAKYFPAISGGLKTIPDDWVCQIISGQKPLGHSKSYFELVWHQARDRAYRTKASEQRNLEASFSARGFGLPPGALVDALTQAEARAADAILEVNVQEAIKDADIKLDLLKFAQSEAARLKLGYMSVLADYYKVLLNLPDKDIERARVKAQAQASAYSALSDYYNVELAFQQLKLRGAELKANIDLSVDRNRISAESAGNSGAAALGTAVQAFASVAGDSAQAGGTFSAELKNL